MALLPLAQSQNAQNQNNNWSEVEPLDKVVPEILAQEDPAGEDLIHEIEGAADGEAEGEVEDAALSADSVDGVPDSALDDDEDRLPNRKNSLGMNRNLGDGDATLPPLP